MTKFKKIVSGTLAGCLMASALMMSAGAANVQTTVISKAGVQAAAQTAAQVRTAVKINPQSANIYVEGIPATFPSEDGKTVYTALSYNGSTYMPLRTVGRWMGKNISWYSAKAENDVNAIFLRMPLSDSKRAEMETYATNLMKQLLDMRTDTQKFENCESAVKNGSYTDYVITDKAAAMAALDSIKRKAQTIRSGMTEQANPIRYYNSSLMNELDFLINNADTVMDRVKNGRVVVGSSNPDTSVVDQTAVMFGADDTMLDCERMVRMLRQNMDRLF